MGAEILACQCATRSVLRVIVFTPLQHITVSLLPKVNSIKPKQPSSNSQAVLLFFAVCCSSVYFECKGRINKFIRQRTALNSICFYLTIGIYKSIRRRINAYICCKGLRKIPVVVFSYVVF